MSKSKWASLAALFSPALAFAVLVIIPHTSEATVRFGIKNWGNIASAWGLGVSFYVLIVAKGARKAAQEARSEERVRTALEELERAAEKCRQIGQFSRDQKWDLVNLRAQEVMASCRATVERWGENAALKESRNKVLQVANLMRSIVEETNAGSVNGADILDAQLDSDNKLAAVVGRIHKEQEARSE